MTHTIEGSKPLPPTTAHVTKQIEQNIKYHIETRESLKPMSKELDSIIPTPEQVMTIFNELTTAKPPPRAKKQAGN